MAKSFCRFFIGIFVFVLFCRAFVPFGGEEKGDRRFFRIFAGMNVKSRIIVLNTLRYGEDKLIAECLTPAEGCVTMLVRITHSRRAAVRHTLFRPLAVLEAEWIAGRVGAMVRPRTVATARPLLSLHSDPVKQTVALFLAEALLHIARSETFDEQLFAYIVNSLDWFDTAPGGYANFHIVFLMRLSLFLGIAPNLSAAHRPYFDLMEARFLTHPPSHEHYIEGREAEAFAQLMRMNFGTMHLFVLSRAQRKRILRLILDYYRLHLAAMPELKSIGVLEEVFS